MDLKALMQKLETINTKQIVKESVETKQVITESVAEPVRKSADPVFKGSIARSLAEEFGYDLEEAEGASPWANDPAKDAAWKALSPEDQKWLGGADPTDPYILARAPNKGKPAAPAAPAAATSAATGVGNPGEEAAAQAAADGAATKPAADQQTIDPAKLARFKELLAKAATPAAPKPAPAAPAAPKKPTQIAPAPKPATGAATKPAAGNSVDWNAIGAGQMTAESNYADDQTLLAIKNIRY